MTTFVGAAKTYVGYYGSAKAVNLPAGLQAGDVLILGINERGPDTDQPTTPSGWTKFATYGESANGGMYLHLYWRIAGSSEGATDPTATLTNKTASTGGGRKAGVLAYRNVDPATPIEATAGNAGTNQTNVTAPAVTVAAATRVVSWWVGGNQPYWTPQSGSGMTTRLQATTGETEGGGLGVADAAQAAGQSPYQSAAHPEQAGAWAVGTIGLKAANNPPHAPTLTTMHDGTVIDRAAVNRAAHTFSDPDPGDSQSAFDHRYRLIGAATWTTAYAATPNGYVDYPAGTFAAGDYERQVRTYDAQGVAGAWSASGYFTAADAPATPTITDPVNNGTVPASASVTWSAPSQDAYQLQVLDGGLVEYDTGTVVSTTRTASAVPFPTNNVTRTVRARVRFGGLWSSWYSITVQVSYTPPPVPTVSLLVSGLGLQVQVGNPAPGVGEPAVTHNRVLIDDGLDDGETLRARIPPNGVWTYWTPRSGLDYEGRVRVVAVGDNGTEVSSA